jgi:hypothetical protein
VDQDSNRDDGAGSEVEDLGEQWEEIAERRAGLDSKREPIGGSILRVRFEADLDRCNRSSLGVGQKSCASA